jgi:hypothetical protein
MRAKWDQRTIQADARSTLPIRAWRFTIEKVECEFGESIMSGIEEIKSAIETLSPSEFVRLRQWLFEKDWHEWDRQIEADSRAGKLDFLIDEATEEKSKGTLQDL